MNPAINGFLRARVCSSGSYITGIVGAARPWLGSLGVTGSILVFRVSSGVVGEAGPRLRLRSVYTELPTAEIPQVL